jgi:hypothetical protein
MCAAARCVRWRYEYALEIGPVADARSDGDRACDDDPDGFAERGADRLAHPDAVTACDTDSTADGDAGFDADADPRRDDDVRLDR